VDDSLSARFSVCAVQGELSGVSRATSGHLYFQLKDSAGADASLRCAMFRRSTALLDFLPADGQRVELRARLAVYQPRGELQLVVEGMRRAGVGSLYEQFLRLKLALESQGLFDVSRKRTLPRFPRRIGIVTSLGAAALHDIASTFARRSPHVAVIVYPTVVQGAQAPAELVRALEAADGHAWADLLLVCRGGGSLEDLWAFNDERVVRAIAGSAIPVVCGVGHETDITLADLAADLRAPTPTAAAELAAPETLELLAQLNRVDERRISTLRRWMDAAAQRLDRFAWSLARPAHAVQRAKIRLLGLRRRLELAQARVVVPLAHRLERAQERLPRSLTTALQRQRGRIEALALRLGAIDPHQVLARGYALLHDSSGAAITHLSQLQLDAPFHVRLVDGGAQAQVVAIDSQ
jgi:exodeoxyribonuclease VII large subunit